MAKSRNTRTKVSSVSIWEPRSCNVLPDANKDEKAQTQFITIDALRAISRIVLAIKTRIAVGDNTGNDTHTCPAGDPSGSTAPSANCGKDTNREKAENR
jgi:hypothetical protein